MPYFAVCPLCAHIFVSNSRDIILKDMEYHMWISHGEQLQILEKPKRRRQVLLQVRNKQFYLDYTNDSMLLHIYMRRESRNKFIEYLKRNHLLRYNY